MSSSHSIRNNVFEQNSVYDITDFRFQHPACHICNGFYGPNFGQPVCATCHAFLCPEDLSLQNATEVFEEKTDSGDSGTEEPTDFYEQSTANLSQIKEHPPQPLSPAIYSNKSADRLAERITYLTCPRKFKDDVPDGLVELLPPEVLLGIFSYLDDISLWCVGQVCRRWQQLLEANTTQEQWKLYTVRRWPLLQILYKVKCWRQVYTSLIKSAPCLLCLLQMSIQMQPSLGENSWRTNRLRSELKSLKSDPPEGIEATPLDELCCHWQASITGPVGSPYQGGTFLLYLQIPYSYPMSPPVVRFMTKIFHPNVSRHGDIGIDSIHHNWSLALTISKILISIQSLLTDPYCRICMEPDIGNLYMNNPAKFNRISQLWTWRYAMPHALIPCSKHSMDDESWQKLTMDESVT